MRKSKKLIAALTACLFAAALLAGCGGDKSGTGTDGGSAAGGGGGQGGDVIKVGIINPTTGPLSGFGEGTEWTEQIIADYVNNELGGIEVDGVKKPIELTVYDSQSDTTVATQMTEKLITDDKVDVVIVRHTPETVNPVSGVCERYETPCIALDAPVDAWLADGPYEWTFHAHWNLDTMYKQYKALWEKAGFGSGSTIGLLFANDADGTAWKGTFKEQAEKDGYVVVDPNQYPAETTDFSDIINQFKSRNVDVLVGTNTCPVFGTFWRQAKQMGFAPGFVTMGKAYLLRADAEAIDADAGIMDGLAGEVWWSPLHPFKSSLTGTTPQELADKYLSEKGREITQPMGYKYASMEILVDALTRAASTDKVKIRDAIAATDLDTIIGPIKYNEDHYSLTPLCGGQWVVDEDGVLQLHLVDNSLNPELDIPTVDLVPLKK
ncbi:MAG: ABC transporter substrate-binding protein [Clostridiales Family XIII bacterium]|jgi:branched-chain amino acid transport system substrate-binding protein|nr:ABC transporter substrate-binding protein [Clostridiales Family XIII bacterium]